MNPDAAEICEDGTDSDCNGFDGQCLLEGTYDLSLADAIFVGEEPENYSGYGIGSAGDVDGDGYDDVFIGAYLNEEGGENAGAAYLLYGPVSGDAGLDTADAKFVGEEANDHAGIRLAGVGDVNGDGFPDLMVGAYYNDRGGDYSGAAYLIYGGGL